MSFVRPVPWTRQPQYPAKINRAHPLGALLQRAWLGSVPQKELLTGLSTPLPSGWALSPTRLGLSPSSTSNGTLVNIASTTTLPMVLFAYGQFTNESSSWRLHSVVNSNAGNRINIQQSASAVAVQVQGAFGTSRTLSVAPRGGNVGNPVFIIAQVFSSTDYRIYANGVQANGTLDCGSPITLNQVYPPGELLNGAVWMCGHGFGSALSDSQALQISADHARAFGVFAPITRRIWVPSTGGATTHTSTGALASQAAVVAGTATHKTLHPSTGSLASQAAVVAGAATHKTLHASTGALAAQAAAVAGTATHTTPSGATHTATGALAAQAAAIAGTAIHRILHTSTGALIAQSAAAIAGTAIHQALHTSSGALASQSATIAGSASGPGPDDVSGDTIVALRSISHNTHRRM